MYDDEDGSQIRSNPRQVLPEDPVALLEGEILRGGSGATSHDVSNQDKKIESMYNSQAAKLASRHEGAPDRHGRNCWKCLTGKELRNTMEGQPKPASWRIDI